MAVRLLTILRGLVEAIFQRGTLAGTWYLLASGKVVFRVAVQRVGRRWRGDWHHPENFQFDGTSFTNVSGSLVKESTKNGQNIAGGIELVFEGAEPDNYPYSMIIHEINSGAAKISFEGTNLQELPLVRSPSRELSEPWDPGRSYDVAVAHSTSAEMEAIFAADQNNGAPRHEPLQAATSGDQQGRNRTSQLLESGQLNSGSDFYHAAFVFQHGDCATDYLLSHLLALAAVARGRHDALWIAAASLDRYLLNIGQPQVLGTQVRTESGAISEPFDRALVPKSLRDALRVPPTGEQTLSNGE
ncbi:hypothetical protein [Sphingomonas crusticola]|uniref:hypothetical protein n=1 Tax=Sphingomonas crusticola TaxID=1697973 RepID=UPI001F08487D|nr:hypothetical protein [Sphingomonas crusticola]